MNRANLVSKQYPLSPLPLVRNSSNRPCGTATVTVIPAGRSIGARPGVPIRTKSLRRAAKVRCINRTSRQIIQKTSGITAAGAK